MDTLAALALARELIDIDSTTGREGAAGRWLADRLRALGYAVSQQRVDDDRFNLFAAIDPPDIVLSTHYDCVPPFISSSVREGRLYGRGACDAKGIVAAQVAALERLRGKGERRVGLLFVVGEERGSDGALTANAVDSESKFLINGEPTGNLLGRGTRGVLRVRLRATGRAGHSSVAERFESAIEKLVDALVRLRSVQLPSDPELGMTSYSVGLIDGGVAPNVVPAQASAEVMFRTVGHADQVLAALESLMPLVSIEQGLVVPPVRLHTVPGFDVESFPFTTDIPFLSRWGVPLLVGPGSFLLAHTDAEHLELSEFEAGIETYRRLVVALRRAD
jgi:acetylornithine deacetylase